jgi:hypothetical protein
MAGIPVLLVDGSARGDQGARDTFFLARAIQPRGKATSLFLPHTVDWPGFQSTDLRDYTIVYVCNPPVLGDAASQKLEQFARTGGIVVLMPGQHHVLEAGLTRLSALGDLKVTKDILPQDRSLGIVPAEEGSQMEARLLSIIPPPSSLVTRQRLVMRGLTTECDVVFRFSDGAPFAVRTPYGQGSIWVMAVSANRDWSEWPLTPFFVVFQQELIKGSVGGRQESRTGEIGASLAVSWPEDAEELDFQLRDPEGRERTIHLTRSGADKPFLVEGFDRPGFYRLVRQGREESLAINIPEAETELSYVTPEAARLPLGNLDCFQSDSWHELQQNLVHVRQGRPLWPLLLSVAFLLAITEELFANIRSRATVLPEALRQFVSRGGRRGS